MRLFMPASSPGRIASSVDGRKRPPSRRRSASCEPTSTISPRCMPTMRVQGEPLPADARERRGRLVEDQDARIGSERAGDGDAMAARQVRAALLDHRVIAPR